MTKLIPILTAFNYAFMSLSNKFLSKNALIIFFWLFILSFSIAQQIKAQTSPYLLSDTLGLKRGIYKNFEEFKYNKPSERAPFDIVEKSRTYNFKSHTQYQLEFVNKKDEDRIILDDVWGFCDGYNIYINGQRHEFGKNNFERLLYAGKYSPYTKFIFAVSGSTNSIIQKVIDIETGNQFTLSENRMDKILSSDPELYKEYLADKESNKKFFDYLKKFNERYKKKFSH